MTPHPDILTACSSASRESHTWARWADLFDAGDIPNAMSIAATGLHEMKARLSPDEWNSMIAGAGAGALRTIAHECPYTRRGFDKPRGYAGDAILLDYIYGGAALPEDTTQRGLDILAWMRRESTGFSSVRWRRDYFAERLDTLAASVHRPRAASFACGHFREGQRSIAVRSNAFETLQVLDSDQVSLDVVTAEQPHVTPIVASVRDIVTGRASLERMDFIYSAGLYDYLADRFAMRLTARLFASLRPGGSLVVANFVRMMEDGWMEAFMEWRLVYRAPEQVSLFSSEIPEAAVASQRVFTDPFSNVAYLEIVKR